MAGFAERGFGAGIRSVKFQPHARCKAKTSHAMQTCESGASAEALFRFAMRKNELKTDADLENFVIKINPIFENSHVSIVTEFPFFMFKYFDLAYSWVPTLKAESFEKLKDYLPYHQTLILLEEALRQNVFKEPWQINFAIAQVQQMQNSKMGDTFFPGEEKRRLSRARSQDPFILKKNQERRLRIFQAASAQLKEMGASSEDFQKLSTSLRIGSLNRALMKVINPFDRFEWPQRDYESADFWPRAKFKNQNLQTPLPLDFNPAVAVCAKIYQK
jgi:hypothetical protein